MIHDNFFIINTLKELQAALSALFYCHHIRRPDMKNVSDNWWTCVLIHPFTLDGICYPVLTV